MFTVEESPPTSIMLEQPQFPSFHDPANIHCSALLKANYDFGICIYIIKRRYKKILHFHIILGKFLNHSLKEVTERRMAVRVELLGIQLWNKEFFETKSMKKPNTIIVVLSSYQNPRASGMARLGEEIENAMGYLWFCLYLFARTYVLLFLNRTEIIWAFLYSENKVYFSQHLYLCLQNTLEKPQKILPYTRGRELLCKENQV